MTRINVVPVEELVDKHLIAEYRELPRIYKAAQKFYDNGEKGSVPEKYVLGTGHMKFFYYRLSYIQKRHLQLIEEMKNRNFKTSFDGSIPDGINLPVKFWKDYKPTDDALVINRQRINDRLSS